MKQDKSRTLKAQMACYLSFNIISLNGHEPRLDCIPLITLSNLLLALRFCLLAMAPPARRYRTQVAWLVAEVAGVVFIELCRDLSKRYVLNAC